MLGSLIYDSFGNMKQHGNKVKQPYTYTGREWDRETGLYYYNARYYDPEMGRFISEDPIGFNGGDVNLYAYVGNNPVNFVDPWGLEQRVVGSRGGQPLVYDTETRQYTIGYPNTNVTDSSTARGILKIAGEFVGDLIIGRIIGKGFLGNTEPVFFDLLGPAPAEACPKK